MEKKILGLDLGVTSIGWAVVTESDDSRIERIGVRVNPLATDEQGNFEKGKDIGVTAERTRNRGARRNLDRYQLRRKALINILVRNKIIREDSQLAETGEGTTHETWRLRAKAVKEEISLVELARVLLAINKKRGYKSNRKVNSADEGNFIDGMKTAMEMHRRNLTPGQWVYRRMQEGHWEMPEFYRSDLIQELDKVWTFQKQFYPEVLTEDFRKILEGRSYRDTSESFRKVWGIELAENNEKSKRDKIKLDFEWRSRAVSEQVPIEQLALVISKINLEISRSSGYLGAIGDRSKELALSDQTVGQYSYQLLSNDPHFPLRGMVFYRQDYLDEFEKIWDVQAQFHKELTTELKEEIRDTIIFYQRRLKSQKGLLSFCEFEQKEVQTTKNGKVEKKTIGLRVAPKSSPLFQEFKVWQTLNNLKLINKATGEVTTLSLDDKQSLFEELNIKGDLSLTEVLKLLRLDSAGWEANFKQLKGNTTNKALVEIYLKVLDMNDCLDKSFTSKQGEILELNKIKLSAAEIVTAIRSAFQDLGIDAKILDFDAELDGRDFERQPSYQLWHLLYSYEGDDSVSGNETLNRLLSEKFGFGADEAKLLGNLSIEDDYGSLSTKAMRRIYPFIREHVYSEACRMAGYNHSSMSLTREEILTRPLENKLRSIKKNELRNPVVEKILNQMVNVVNELIDVENSKRAAQGLSGDFHFDEIRIELARELKVGATARQEMHSRMEKAAKRHEDLVKKLQSKFGIRNPTRNDIVKYKLYEELRNNGYKDLYTNRYIPEEILFSNQIDVDHIIPQMTRFDDSFSNKTLSFRSTNQAKGNRTAYDFISEKFGGEALEAFISRIDKLQELGRKGPEEGLSKAKWLNLKKRMEDIGDGFIERDLRDSQYIARKARTMLLGICRSVVATTGKVTAKLRQDWGLVNLMKEINLPKYRSLGLTEKIVLKDGSMKEGIIEWTKRDDHRHHAVDAIVIAFTKRSHIEYLNYLNARQDTQHRYHNKIMAIQNRDTQIIRDDFGNRERQFNPPFANFRTVAKEHILSLLVSHKAKNKVVTRNKNRIQTRGGEKVFIEQTPRGQLHMETVYRRYNEVEALEEKVSSKFDAEKIETVTNPVYRKLLSSRLAEFDNDPKKAFTGRNSLARNPIYIDESRTSVVPEKVKVINQTKKLAKRVDVSSLANMKVKKVKGVLDKVLDTQMQRLLRQRLEEYNEDPKKAFSDLEKKPIWLNKEKGIRVKRVAMVGVRNAIPLHFKWDHLGNFILDSKGGRMPSSFVSTGNNHHVAIYRDSDGKLMEKVVSFFEAVERVNAGLPIVDREYNAEMGWSFCFTMKQNEMFVFPNEELEFDPTEMDLLDPNNYSAISPNLFRVQKIATRNYYFRHHIETNVSENSILKGLTYKAIQSTSHLNRIVKVRINAIGQIVQIGEY